MLIEYFKNNFYNETSCERLRDGFYFPMPNQRQETPPLEDGINSQLLPQYPSTHNAIYLPYVPRRINVCSPDYNQDVLSSPFSGCRLVKFKFRGICLLDVVSPNGGNNCRDKKYGCSVTCRWKKILVGHVDYPNCRNLWHNIAAQSKVFVSFKPMTNQAITVYNRQPLKGCAPTIYGLISSTDNYGSVIINGDKRVAWFDFM